MLGIAAFQICRIVGKISIARRMGFIEGILGKGCHIVIYFLRRLLGHAVIYTAGHLDVSVFILFAVDEVLPLAFHDILFLFTHGTSYNIGSAEGITCKFSENLHYLFLINYTAVGDIKNIFKFRI